jgi:serine/threonine protein kinase
LTPVPFSFPLAAIFDEPEFGSGLDRTLRLPQRLEAEPDSHDNLFIRRSPIQPGTVIGDYLVTAILSARGRDSVCRAVNQTSGQRVVIKGLGFGHEDSTTVKRFRRELSVISQLDHPGIVKTLATIEEQGRLFLVMEELVGCDVAQLCDLLGPLPVPEASAIAQQSAETLDWLHKRQIIHRDLKPSNLFLTTSGQVKLIDFGLAHALDWNESLTHSGQVLGTIDYMSPEQAVDSRNVTSLSDIYSLGCTLFKLLTGQAPYGGRHYRHFLRKALAHAAQPFPAVRSLNPEIPGEVEEAILKACAKDQTQRFQNANQFAAALRPFTQGSDLVEVAQRASQLESEEPLWIGSEVDSATKGNSVSHYSKRKPGHWLVLPLIIATFGLLGTHLWPLWTTPVKRAPSTEQATQYLEDKNDSSVIHPDVVQPTSTLAGFNEHGDFEHGNCLWSKAWEPFEKAVFAHTKEKSLSGQWAMSSVPSNQVTGAGSAIYCQISGLDPKETYVLSAGFETSEMTSGCLGCDVEGDSFYKRLSAHAGVLGWQYGWCEFSPDQESIKVRLVHDFNLNIGERGFFDCLKLVPKSAFEPIKAGVAVTVEESSSVKLAWKTQLRVKAIRGLGFDGRSRFLATSSLPFAVMQDIAGWDKGVWIPPQEIEVPDECALIGFSPIRDELLLHSNKSLAKWSPTSGNSPEELLGLNITINAVSQDGRLLLYQGEQGLYQVVDLVGNVNFNLPVFSNREITSACFSENNKCIAIATKDKWSLFEFKENKLEQISELLVSDIAGLSLSLEGKRLVAIDSKSIVYAWQLAPVTEVCRFETSFRHSGPVRISPDGKTALIANAGGSVWLYDLATGKPLWSHWAVSGVFESSTRFATVSPDGTLCAWNLRHD